MEFTRAAETFAAALVEYRVALLTIAWFIGFLGFGAYEALRPRRPGQVAVDRRWLSHIGIILCNVALIEFTIGDPHLIAGEARGLLPISALTGGSVLAGILLGVLATDFLRYWIHRINHIVPPLWRLHALHHADDKPDVTTSFRHHPAEHVLLVGTVWVSHLLFGASAEALVVYGVLMAITSPLQHANVRFAPRLERALEWVFVSNAVHLSHHSTEASDGAVNFGIMFSFWDRLFGTFRAPDPVRMETIRYGLDEVPGESCADFKAMMLLPVRFEAR